MMGRSHARTAASFLQKETPHVIAGVFWVEFESRDRSTLHRRCSNSVNRGPVGRWFAGDADGIPSEP
jgi:hypothetical protein